MQQIDLPTCPEDIKQQLHGTRLMVRGVGLDGASWSKSLKDQGIFQIVEYDKAQKDLEIAYIKDPSNKPELNNVDIVLKIDYSIEMELKAEDVYVTETHIIDPFKLFELIKTGAYGLQDPYEKSYEYNLGYPNWTNFGIDPLFRYLDKVPTMRKTSTSIISDLSVWEKLLEKLPSELRNTKYTFVPYNFCIPIFNYHEKISEVLQEHTRLIQNEDSSDYFLKTGGKKLTDNTSLHLLTMPYRSFQDMAKHLDKHIDELFGFYKALENKEIELKDEMWPDWINRVNNIWNHFLFTDKLHSRLCFVKEIDELCNPEHFIKLETSIFHATESEKSPLTKEDFIRLDYENVLELKRNNQFSEEKIIDYITWIDKKLSIIALIDSKLSTLNGLLIFLIIIAGVCLWVLFKEGYLAAHFSL